MAETRADAILRLWWTTELTQQEIAGKIDTDPTYVSKVLIDTGIRSRVRGESYERCACGRGHVEYRGLCRRCAQSKRYAKGDVKGQTYGFFPGGNPREFTPDPTTADTATLREWMEACVKGERVSEAEGRAFGLGYFPDRVRIIPLS